MRWPWKPNRLIPEDEEVFSEPSETSSTYPRFTYLITWKYLPEPRRYLKPTTLHFEKQLTQREMRTVSQALHMRDSQFSCSIKNVTGKPANVALSASGIQKRRR